MRKFLEQLLETINKRKDEERSNMAFYEEQMEMSRAEMRKLDESASAVEALLAVNPDQLQMIVDVATGSLGDGS